MDLIIDEGRVYGSRYYTVALNFRADPATWFRLEWEEIEEWCENTYGPTPVNGLWTPNCRWYVNDSKFWFREKKDLEWFVLKWT